jgi:hypothetical protein
MQEPVRTARGRQKRREQPVMSEEQEPGSDKVTAGTRAFEEIDAQVFPGPGRGATPLEAAASDRWGGASPATVDAYRRMMTLVVKHEQSHRDPMNQHSRRPPTTPVAPIGPSDDDGHTEHELNVAALDPSRPTSRATSHQREQRARREPRNV